MNEAPSRFETPEEEEERLFQQLLEGFQAGELAAREQLFRLVYADLHRLARGRMGAQGRMHTLQATALVHEAYLKLSAGKPLKCRDRSHLLRAAARAMGQILADHARQKASQKRGGGWSRVELGSGQGGEPFDPAAYLDFDSEVERLSRIAPEMARAMQLRFILGLGPEEIAPILDIPQRTFDRRFKSASALVAARLS